MTIKHRSRPNSYSWKWRLVLMLTGGEIEAAPLLPLRAIYPNEVLRIRLGREGAYNTVEVKSMVQDTTHLIPIDNWKEALAPNCFIALDMEVPGPDTDNTVRYVGTFVGWSNGQLILVEAATGRRMDFDWTGVVAAYWAPMGYRG